jgi:hypothetical protein
MAPRPFLISLLKRHQEQVIELRHSQTMRLDAHPDLGSANARQYVATQQKEVLEKTFRYVLELFSMLKKVDKTQAHGLRTMASYFEKCCEADFGPVS